MKPREETIKFCSHEKKTKSLILSSWVSSINSLIDLAVRAVVTDSWPQS